MYKRFIVLLIAAGVLSLFPTGMGRTYGDEAKTEAPVPAVSQEAVKERPDISERVRSLLEERGRRGERPPARTETGQTNGDAAKTEASASPEQPLPDRMPPVMPLKQFSVSKGNISFFFDDVDMFEVIQSVFGEVLKVNYIIDPRVKGRVNFRTVTPIPKSEVLPVMETIFRLNGVGFVQENGLYRVLPIEAVPDELIYSQIGKGPGAVAMELFIFKNLDIRYSMKEIESAAGISVSGARVRVIPVERLNGILVVASAKEQLDYVRKWVETFDTIFEGSRPEVFVYPVQNSNAKDVAGVLQQIFLGGPKDPKESSKPAKASPQPAKTAQTAAASPASSSSSIITGGESLVSDITRIFPDEIANTIIIYATPKDYELISRTITKIDIVPRQVMIEALVAEVTLGDKLKFGIEWFLKSGFKFEGTPLTGLTSFSSQQLSFDAATPLALSAFSFAAIDSAGLIRGLLQTLASESKVKVLASPHIMASDNREAKIQVGKQVPVQTSTSVTSGGETVTSIQYRDTGVVLKVKPHINEGGLVSLEISQEVSSVDPDSGVGGNPIISNRTAETNVVIQNGQTIVIGGLIQENKGTSREGIPILKDIPLLGYLFGYTSQSTDRTELVVMITPKVVKSSGEAKAMTDEFLQKTEGLKDLPVSDAKEEVVGSK